MEARLVLTPAQRRLLREYTNPISSEEQERFRSYFSHSSTELGTFQALLLNQNKYSQNHHRQAHMYSPFTFGSGGCIKCTRFNKRMNELKVKRLKKKMLENLAWL